MAVETIRWLGGRPGRAVILEQTLLPREERYVELTTATEMFDAIRRLAVRGAPALGVAAAFGVLLGIQHAADQTAHAVVTLTEATAAHLGKSRPTAVNLFWALERMVARARRDHTLRATGSAIVEGLFEEARAIFEEDRATCRRIGEVGATLISHGQSILTHCNAGGLATADYGTALAPVYVAKEQGKDVHVFADETRPLLQGARLTAWELQAAGIPVTLITDSMAGRVMFEGRIQAVFVGADRIAANGDVCNKIGTYSVAVLAREHRIPFYVCAPLSTVDANLADGSQIPIEERDPREVTEGFGVRTAPEGVAVYNPAFDVTPARLVTAIVTEVGLIERPNTEGVAAALARGRRKA
ncbi:MAG: S-methyl-5-thioribose-1-phosphate isomerase [Planctomycetes bacterium]|jgi:methylthioribose-1-phosphate isomerase|nr:S-methyl-5-thioribose-1-phosphate isomerase [Planctomycetota bacterium]